MQPLSPGPVLGGHQSPLPNNMSLCQAALSCLYPLLCLSNSHSTESSHSTLLSQLSLFSALFNISKYDTSSIWHTRKLRQEASAHPQPPPHLQHSLGMASSADHHITHTQQAGTAGAWPRPTQCPSPSSPAWPSWGSSRYHRHKKEHLQGGIESQRQPRRKKRGREKERAVLE